MRVNGPQEAWGFWMLSRAACLVVPLHSFPVCVHHCFVDVGNVPMAQTEQRASEFSMPAAPFDIHTDKKRGDPLWVWMRSTLDP